MLGRAAGQVLGEGKNQGCTLRVPGHQGAFVPGLRGRFPAVGAALAKPGVGSVCPSRALAYPPKALHDRGGIEPRLEFPQPYPSEGLCVRGERSC